MKANLGVLEDLPPDYVRGLKERNLMPLWPSLGSALPRNAPERKARPTLWRYADVRPQLLRAGALTPIEKAERRVLVLCNPGYGLDDLRATPTIYIGLQLILPGETAPNHKHTPSAIRLVIEGEGGYTLVDGEKLPMERGDLILTPSGVWHEHGHDGRDPVIWMDALDLPLMLQLDASYSIEAPHQSISDPDNTSRIRFSHGGIVPYSSLARPAVAYPLMRYRWLDVKETLDGLARLHKKDELVRVGYVNPETGRECLPTLGVSALRVQPHEPAVFARQSASMVFYTIEGEGTMEVDGMHWNFGPADIMAVPTYADVHIEATGTKPAYLFIVDDAPVHRKLGFYEVFAR